MSEATKIDPPLVEGEWVVAESKVGSADGGEVYFRIEGPVTMKAGMKWVSGYLVENADDWTFIKRRPRKPDWADADAIEVEFRTGARGCHLRTQTQGVEWSAFSHRSEMSWLTDPAVKSIRGLYFRDPS